MITLCGLFQEWIRGIEAKFPEPDHPDLALSYNNVDGTYSSLGKHQEAVNYHRKALAIWEKVLPDDHPDLACSYNNIAWAYYEIGNFRDAA